MTLFCPECGEYYEDSLSVCPADGVRLFTLNSTQAPLIGEVLEGRFRIESLLGSGGMGAVYRAVQTSVGRDVAIKVLHADFEDDQAALERFFREAKFVSELTHPSIVRVIDFGQEPRLKVLYLVMELIEGPTLDALIRGTRLDLNFALEIAYQICGGLTDPHASHVVHRDLKPANLFVNPVSDGSIQVKICDFGIARALTRATRLTMEGGICGTPAYMSPEQASDLPLDPRTDLYSLGVILYQMLTGWLPFDAPSSLQLMLKHVQETPPPFAEILGDDPLPASVERLVTDLMQKSADARPATAREVRARINRIRSELGLMPIQLDASGSSQRDMFSKWIIATEPQRNTSPGAPADSAEFAGTLAEAPSNTDTALLAPSLTETHLLPGRAHQAPPSGRAQTGEAPGPLPRVRVPTQGLGRSNEIAPTTPSPLAPSPAPGAQTPAPGAQTPDAAPQRTAPQPAHTAESHQKVASSHFATVSPSQATQTTSSNRLLLAILALMLGALLVATGALGFLWSSRVKTPLEAPSKIVEPVQPAPQTIIQPAQTAPKRAGAAQAQQDAVAEEMPEVAPPERPAQKPAERPKTSPSSTPPAAKIAEKPVPKEKPAARAQTPPAPAPSAPKTQPQAPGNTPKTTPAPPPNEAAERLDSIFGNRGLRKE